MSDLRQRLVKELNDRFFHGASSPDVIVDALVELPGVAIVQLPTCDQYVDDTEEDPVWFDSDFEIVSWSDGVIAVSYQFPQPFGKTQILRGNADDIRGLAAALLAAADVADPA